ncbi:MAG: hypothetical protein CMI26_04475, partial [Opitutae bacterium]|nr:hypothetical protein [Opitutae bacterium]
MKPIQVMLLAMSLKVSLTGTDKTDLSPDHYFINEVWAKVGELSCLKCHQDSGEAEDSRFILQETILLNGKALQTARIANFKAFAKMARMKKVGHPPRLLLKPIGEMDHEGEQVLKPDSTGHTILKAFVQRMEGKSLSFKTIEKYKPSSFFEGVTMIENESLLRRLTLSLAGRLPTPKERQDIRLMGLPGLNGILEKLMAEKPFFDRLKEGFNDIFLTNGYDGNGELILS